MKMFEDVMRELISERAYACKKIKLDQQKQIEPVVDKIVKYLKYFNTIGEFDTKIFDLREFSEVNIPNEFKDFITPKCVKYVPGSRQSYDLLVRDDIDPEAELLSLPDWIDTYIEWRGFFKKDGTSDLTTLATLKVERSFNDVLPESYFVDDDGNSFLRYENTPYVPIRLEPAAASLFRADYFNSDVTTIVRDYLTAVTF